LAGCVPGEPGIDLSCASADGAQGLAEDGVARNGERPASALLPVDSEGTAAAGGRAGGVGAFVKRGELGTACASCGGHGMKGFGAGDRNVGRRAGEGGLDDELEFHLEMEREKLEREGVAPAEARRKARLSLGGYDRIAEETREAGGFTALENAW